VSLNPEDRKNWLGFLDLLQPPPGYKRGAALGTTFGLSVEALTAALLCMADADGEEMAANPVAATMAITRLSEKVRVLVHPATTTGPAVNSGTNRFIALLDRLVVELQPAIGLFHPKVWAVRFEHVGPLKKGTPAEIGRLLVASRNLTGSTCFELGAAFEGVAVEDGAVPSQFAGDVAAALRQWLAAVGPRFPDAVTRLPRFVGSLGFDLPHEAETSLRLRWQGRMGGMAQKPLADFLPDRLKRTVVVSPFIQPDFVADALARSEQLQIVSIPDSLDALPDETIAAFDARAEAQGSPVLYQVTEHGNTDDAFIDGIHAKLLLVEDRYQRSTTLVGSANATGPGWGLGGPANVEAVVEMQPGIGIDRFVNGFIRPDKTKVHPWISEYDRTARPEPDEEKETERRMLAALREVARIDIVLKYDIKHRRLTLSRGSRKSGLPPWVSEGGLKYSVAPLLLADDVGAWRPLSQLETGGCQFEDVDVARVTTFVVLRVQSRKPVLEVQRFVLAKLEVDELVLEERDRAIRADIMATADPAMVLNALLRGLAHVRSSDDRGEANRKVKGHGLRELLAETSLERLLQAVALEPELVQQMRLLLVPLHGDPLLELCNDLEEVTAMILAEAKS
jgi:hypothetical protein